MTDRNKFFLDHLTRTVEAIKIRKTKGEEEGLHRVNEWPCKIPPLGIEVDNAGKKLPAYSSITSPESRKATKSVFGMKENFLIFG